jgi:two-component system cell cycle response regulator
MVPWIRREDEAMQNKRKERREATIWPGRIAYERGAQLRECVVRDISKEGARLALANPRTVPGEFELLILTTGEIFQAVAKWRRGREIGVYFIEKDGFLNWADRGVEPAPAA